MAKTIMIVAFAAAFLLAFYFAPRYTGEQRAAAELPPGSRFELEQPISLPAHDRAIYFQAGRQVRQREIDSLAYSCEMELEKPAAQAREVSAGSLTVRAVSKTEQYQSPDQMLREDRFEVDPSPADLPLRRIVCRGWTQGSSVGAFSIADLKTALDPYFGVLIAD
ncbi:MAG: hypothetical protein KDH88_18120 [Chromatiales bacterium]|nr:hypothetical protein [Chromatiales bacterium]